jgi:hypothetical protein
MMANMPISDIWGWLLAEIALISAIGLGFLISGIREFMRGPFSSLLGVTVGVLFIGSSAFLLFAFFVPPAMDFDLRLRLTMVFGILLAAVALTSFIVLISWSIFRQYSLPPSAPHWLHRWIAQQKRADAESGGRMIARREARRQARAARRQA